MAKTNNTAPAPSSTVPEAPATVPRVTLVTTEGITTVINPPAEKAGAVVPPTEETE